MADTCLALIKNAMLSIGAIGIRDTPEAHDADYCLEKLQDLILSLPCFGTWKEVETITDYAPQAFAERIAVIGDVSVTITLPQLVEASVWQLASLPNFTLITGTMYAAPRDGSRVLVYAQQGTDRAGYAYRGDTGKWLTFLNLGLTDEIPLNADLHGFIEAMLAIDIAPAYGAEVSGQIVDRSERGKFVMRNRFKNVEKKPLDYMMQSMGRRVY